jgi:thioredoxin-like negative regulator of GroEL
MDDADLRRPPRRGPHGAEAQRTDAVGSVTDATFEEELHAPTPLLIEFALTCGASYPVVAPALEEVAARLTGRVRVVRLDVAQSPDARTRLRIWRTPTIVLFVDGARAMTVVGYAPTGRLVAAVERYLSRRPATRRRSHPARAFPRPGA